jgi:hypothetical protein
MEAPKDALARAGMVVLDEREVDACLAIPILTVGFEENPPVVPVDGGLDPPDADQRSFTHSDHQRLLFTLVILSDILRYTLRI